MPWIAPRKVRSTPILAVALSNSGSPDQGRVDRKGTEQSSLFRRGGNAFFVYGFPKSERANIDADEERQFKQAAKHVLALTEGQLAEFLKKGDFVEIEAK